MYNFLILCEKDSGIAFRHYGQVPRSYDRDAIAGLALMIDGFHQAGGYDHIVNDDFKIIINKQEAPYTITNDGSIIRLLKGKHINAIVSINNEDDLIPAQDLLNDYDQPVTFNGNIRLPSLNEIICDSLQSMVKTKRDLQ